MNAKQIRRLQAENARMLAMLKKWKKWRPAPAPLSVTAGTTGATLARRDALIYAVENGCPLPRTLHDVYHIRQYTAKGADHE